jgi:RecB family exonuclease
LTAHRAKGLEWDLVVVAGVQDGVWPDVRRRGSLLSADRLGSAGVEPPASAATRTVDERRLFYVAITRARRHLFVTAVQSVDDAGPRPSRFLEELGVELPAPQPGPGELLSARALAGRLRQVVVDSSSTAALRTAAAVVLGRMAAPLAPAGAERETAEPAVAAALPSTWWGMAEGTPGGGPVRPAEQPVALSASALAQFARCPLRWFLDREARAAQPASAAQGFGNVVHALARVMSTDSATDVDGLIDRVDTVWDALGLETAWHGDQQRQKARAALGRLAQWLAASQRTHVGSEIPFGPVLVGGAALAGRVDRLDADDDGRLHIVDYKTSGQKPTKAEVKADLQLGFYQLAGQVGAFDDVAGGRAVLGGAELVQLVAGLAGGQPSVQHQAALPEGGGDVAAALGRMVGAVTAETFPARPDDHCKRCPFRRACPAHEDGRQVLS